MVARNNGKMKQKTTFKIASENKKEVNLQKQK